MGRLSYFFKRLVKMDWKAMWKTTGLLKERSGKSRLWLMADMLRCAIKYNAGYIDYKIAQMYRLNDAQRATVITRGISNSIVRRMNDKAYWHLFDDKTQFNALFREYIPAEMAADYPGHGACGPGGHHRRADAAHRQAAGRLQRAGHCLKFTQEDWAKGPAAFKVLLLEKGIGILEEIVVQHPDMASLCPTSVNTCRIATLLGDKKQGIVYAFLRIGNGKVMDNVDCGGMAARIDLESGKLLTVGADKQGNTFTKHPMTGNAHCGLRPFPTGRRPRPCAWRQPRRCRRCALWPGM